MTIGQWILIGMALVVLLYLAYVLFRIVHAKSYARQQKVLQSLIVLLLPLVGAMFVHVVIRTDDEEPGKEDKGFVPQDIGSL